MVFRPSIEVQITDTKLIDETTVEISFTVEYPPVYKDYGRDDQDRQINLIASYPEVRMKGHVVELPARREFDALVPVGLRDVLGDQLTLPL